MPGIRPNALRIIRPSSRTPESLPSPQPLNDGQKAPNTSNGQFSLPVEELQQSGESQPEPQPEQTEAQTQAAPPVILVPGESQITIASEDLDALDQLESLLRQTVETRRNRNRDFSSSSFAMPERRMWCRR